MGHPESLPAPLPDSEPAHPLRVLEGGAPGGPADWRGRTWVALGWSAVLMAALAVLNAAQEVLFQRGPAQEAAVSVASWVLFATILQACAGMGMAHGSRSNAWALRVGLGAIAGMTAAEGGGLANPVVGLLGAWIGLSFVARPRD